MHDAKIHPNLTESTEYLLAVALSLLPEMLNCADSLAILTVSNVEGMAAYQSNVKGCRAVSTSRKDYAIGGFV